MTTPTDEWRAILADTYGWTTTDPDEIAHKLTDENADGAISIRRRTALPNEHGRLPGSWTSADVFMETDLDDVEMDEAEEFWALTLAAAQGMNQWEGASA